MRERLFRFKQFAVDHSQSAMKVGIDGILIGAWADVIGCKEILDIGAGCGLVSLMAAQRNSSACITAVEIDRISADECSANAEASPWSSRICTLCEDATDAMAYFRQRRYDCIISNPPYFKSGVTECNNSRLVARHAGSLSPESVVDIAASLLTERGKTSMVIPSEHSETLCMHAASSGLHLRRKLFVRDRADRPWKRVLLEFGKEATLASPEISHLTLHDDNGCVTPDFKLLCRDFYLHM